MIDPWSTSGNMALRIFLCMCVCRWLMILLCTPEAMDAAVPACQITFNDIKTDDLHAFDFTGGVLNVGCQGWQDRPLIWLALPQMTQISKLKQDFLGTTYHICLFNLMVERKHVCVGLDGKDAKAWVWHWTLDPANTLSSCRLCSASFAVINLSLESNL